MIGILNRWRQFGRRYFWSHLLLGMVAAALGVPQNLTEIANQTALPNASSSLNRLNFTRSDFNRLLVLQKAHGLPTFNVDYWQDSLRNVVQHLSFSSLLPQSVDIRQQNTSNIASVPSWQMASAALLIDAPKQPTTISDTPHLTFALSDQNHPRFWLAHVKGIRAGPVLFI